MSWKSKHPNTPSQNGKAPSVHGGSDLLQNSSAGDTLTADAKQHASLLGRTRAMLFMAVEGAFDLRLGRKRSSYLERFDKLLNEQIRALDEIESSESAADPKFLARRARETLNGFAQAVRQEIVEAVRPDISPDTFDAKLEDIKALAVAAGAALGSIDLARRNF